MLEGAKGSGVEGGVIIHKPWQNQFLSSHSSLIPTTQSITLALTHLAKPLILFHSCILKILCYILHKQLIWIHSSLYQAYAVWEDMLDLYITL